MRTAVSVSYQKHLAGNGLYFFVIEGQVVIDSTRLDRRSGLGLIDGDRVQIDAHSAGQLLLIEVPLSN